MHFENLFLINQKDSLFSNCSSVAGSPLFLLECPAFRTVCHRPPASIFPVEVFLRTSVQEESLVVASDILGRPQREMDYPWRRNRLTRPSPIVIQLDSIDHSAGHGQQRPRRVEATEAVSSVLPC